MSPSRSLRTLMTRITRLILGSEALNVSVWAGKLRWIRRLHILVFPDALAERFEQTFNVRAKIWWFLFFFWLFVQLTHTRTHHTVGLCAQPEHNSGFECAAEVSWGQFELPQVWQSDRSFVRNAQNQMLQGNVPLVEIFPAWATFHLRLSTLYFTTMSFWCNDT